MGKFPFQVLATDSSQPAQKQSSSYTLNVVIGMDEYSGLTAAPVPGCTPTGYFQLVKVKIGSNPARWVYADPNCYAFYSVVRLCCYFRVHPGQDPAEPLRQRFQQVGHALAAIGKWPMASTPMTSSTAITCCPFPKAATIAGPRSNCPSCCSSAPTRTRSLTPPAIGLPEAIKSIIGGQDNNGYQLP